MTTETTAVVQNVRLSYVNVFKPYSNNPDLPAKYSTTILLPKSDLASKQRLDAAIQAAAQKGLNEKWNGVMPPVVANPIMMGTELNKMVLLLEMSVKVAGCLQLVQTLIDNLK